MKNFSFVIFFLLLLDQLGFSQVVKIETLSSGLLAPVDIKNSGIPGDDRLFVVEKRGRIKIVDRNTGAITPTPFLDIYNKVYPVTSSGDERGLLGLAFHPDYINNGYFYLNYINTIGKTIIARYQVSAFADTALSTSEQIILTVFQPYTNHNGGNMMFGPDDGYLYIALGDGGSGGDPQNRAQNVDSLLGKTLRIDINNPAPPYYFSPPGNPFYGSIPGRDEIFDWGLRNQWRCSFDRLTHDLWTADVGQSQVEEINFRQACDTIGHNYGWRCYEGNTAYNTSGCQAQSTYVAPVFVYSHSLGCSVTGGYVYRGAQEGGLFGKYLFTDFCQGRIWATAPNGSGGWTTNQLTQSTAQINNNFSSFGEDIDGELYMAAVSAGKIYRLRDTACAPVAHILAPDTLFSCTGNQVTIQAINGTGLTYNWTVLSGGNWILNSGQGSSVINLTPDQDSTATVFVSVSNGSCSAVSSSVLVIAKTNFTGLASLYCNFSSSTTLSGYPFGGLFEGVGVSGNIFDPSLAGVGTHTISYSLYDTLTTCNYKASGYILTQVKSVTVSLCNGVEKLNILQTAKVYPNPIRSNFNIRFNTTFENEVQLKVSDLLGKIIYQKTENLDRDKQEISIQLPTEANGVYLLTLTTKENTLVKKICVLNE